MPFPDVPGQMLREAGWEKRSESKQTVDQTVEFSGVSLPVTLHQNSVQWSKSETGQNVQSVGGSSLLGVARFGVEPNVFATPIGIVDDQVLSSVEQRFEAQGKRLLEQRDVKNVEVITEGELNIDSGGEAQSKLYRGEYTIPNQEIMHQGVTMDVSQTKIPVYMYMVYWVDEDSVLIVSGVYPGSKTVEVTTEREGRELSRDVDIGGDGELEFLKSVIRKVD